jgi:serine/threonine protein kinase
MINFPNLETYGYEVVQQLGQNIQGGRVTYKAIKLETQQPVVIKQFLFATSNDWSGYKAVESEIQVLRNLNHRGIPHYLDSFEPGAGLCLVQEYKDAQPLSVPRSFAPEEVKQIAVKLLEILVYLQQENPPVIHRDIKPENILVDKQLNVYLVDFGLARLGGGQLQAMSSVVAGTTGFMPPEQLLNRTLMQASDLYGLGATLICLLTNTKSIDLNNLVDSSFRINFQHLVPKISLRFIDWLETMVQPNLNDRYENAETALKALNPLYVIRVPEVKISASSLEFKASKIGECLTQTITITNSIPETVLEGKWQVAPHTSDPPHTPDAHAWIQFSPQKFKGNQVECQVTVDTSKLMADKLYKREILLSSNAEQENHGLKVEVRTATPIIVVKKFPYLDLAFIWEMTGIVSVIGWAIGGTIGGTIGWAISVAIGGGIGGMIVGGILGAIVGGILGAIVGTIRVAIGGKFEFDSDKVIWIDLMEEKVPIPGFILGAIIYTSFMGMLIGILTVAWFGVATVGGLGGVIIGVIIGVIVGGISVGTVGGISVVIVASIVMPSILLLSRLQERGFNKLVAWLCILVNSGFITSIFIGAVVGLSPHVILALVITGLLLMAILVYYPIKKRILIAQYYRQERKRNLIAP